LSGSSETVGDTSVGKTVSIASGIDKSVSKTILAPTGSTSNTVSGNINTGAAGPGPVVVDLFSKSFELIKIEGGSPDVSASIEKMDNIWSEEPSSPAGEPTKQRTSGEDDEN